MIPEKHVAESGLTLIELMVVIVLLAILVTVGVPSFQSLVVQNRAVALSNDLLYHLQLARSQALSQSLPVSVCPIVTGNSSVCSGTTDWGEGWILFIDENGDGSVNGTDSILRVMQESKQVTSFSGPEWVTYTSVGGASISSFSIVIEQVERWVCVELSGRAEVSETGCS